MTVTQRQQMKRQIETIADVLHDAQETLLDDVKTPPGESRDQLMRALDNLHACDTMLVSLMKNVLGEKV